MALLIQAVAERLFFKLKRFQEILLERWSIEQTFFCYIYLYFRICKNRVILYKDLEILIHIEELN